jgi:peptidoglycan/xylan/chitin deacetylase (PgdA/CDA1 family)
MKKAILRRVLSLPGITAVKWRTLRTGLYCFNYHRIGDPQACAYDREVFSCTAQRFEEHVTLLKDRFELVNLERLRFYLKRGAPTTQPLALITFDDGYIDNYRAAFPVLRKLDATAVFFLPTGFIGTDRIPWWDQVAWVLRRARQKQLRLSTSPEVFSLEPAAVERTISRLLRLVKEHRHLGFERQIEDIRKACGNDTPCPEEPLFLTWEHAHEMHAAGMDIGSHTHSHCVLSQLNEAEQEKELAVSKDILEGQLKTKVTSVAYPEGNKWAYSDETFAVARRLGYEVGFSYRGHTNPLPLTNRFEIGRLAVACNMNGPALRSLACFPGQFS